MLAAGPARRRLRGSVSNTFCPQCLRTDARLVTGSTFCPHCREALAPLPATFVAQLQDWLTAQQERRHVAASSGVRSDPGAPIVGRIRKAPSGKKSHAPRLELVVKGAEGRRLPGPRVAIPLLLGPRGRETRVDAMIGRSRNTPTYFLARAQKDGAAVKLGDELNELGYSEKDEVVLEPTGDGRGFAIRPSGKARESAPLLAVKEHHDVVPTLAARRQPQWSQDELRVLVDEYDRGEWRGKGNVALDREAYRLFEHGLEVDDARLVDMLFHVGANYGGAFVPDGDVRLQAQRLATAVRADRHKLIPVLKRQASLIDRVPLVADVVALLAPFRSDKTRFVWGAKFLHFLCPETFPIIDRTIEYALGHRQRLGNYAGYLVAFCGLVRDVALANLASLTAVRRQGREFAEPSILKVLDKALWVLGNRERRRQATPPR